MSELDVRASAPRQQPLPADVQPVSAFPQPGEVLAEIGLILAVHLAAVLAVTLTFRAFGIA